MSISIESNPTANSRLSKLALIDSEISPISYLENNFRDIESSYYEIFHNGERAKYKQCSRKERLLMISTYLATQSMHPSVHLTAKADIYFKGAAEIVSLGIADRIAKFRLNIKSNSESAYIHMLDSVGKNVPNKLFGHLKPMSQEIEGSTLNYTDTPFQITDLPSTHTNNSEMYLLGNLGNTDLHVSLGREIHGSTDLSGITVFFHKRRIS